MAEYDEAAVTQAATQQPGEITPPVNYRVIEPSEKWKIRKPHPRWEPQLRDPSTRSDRWLQLSENDRIWWSDALGPRRG